MNWQTVIATVLAEIKTLQPSMVPAEIAFLQGIATKATNPIEVAFLQAAIAALQASVPPGPAPAGIVTPPYLYPDNGNDPVA